MIPKIFKEKSVRFISLLFEFSKLLINDYSQIRGINVINHHINLKEGSVLLSQKLCQLGMVQKVLLKEVKVLLRACFICLVEVSKWVLPIVVVPKNNGKWCVYVDFKPLIASTKRDHFPPF